MVVIWTQMNDLLVAFSNGNNTQAQKEAESICKTPSSSAESDGDKALIAVACQVWLLWDFAVGCRTVQREKRERHVATRGIEEEQRNYFETATEVVVSRERKSFRGGWKIVKWERRIVVERQTREVVAGDREDFRRGWILRETWNSISFYNFVSDSMHITSTTRWTSDQSEWVLSHKSSGNSTPTWSTNTSPYWATVKRKCHLFCHTIWFIGFIFSNWEFQICSILISCHLFAPVAFLEHWQTMRRQLAA